MDDNHESLEVSMGTANIVGVVLSTMTFGFHLSLFSDLNRLYFCRTGRREQRRPSRRDWQLLAYVYILLLLSTTGLCLQTWTNHDAFVIHGTYPGGPLAYLAQRAHSPVHVTVTSMYAFVNCFTDGMLLYRAYVLSMYPKGVVTACIVSLMALVGTGGYFIHSIAVDGINLWTSCVELTPCITYLTLSFGINLVFTVGIIWRLCYIRREIGGTLGSEVAHVYTSTAAMLIESASLHTVVSLLAIIACARRIPMEGALLPMLGQLQAISPTMVAHRVMSGRAVTSETWSQTVTLSFRIYPSLIDSPASRGCLSEVSADYDASSSFDRPAKIHMTPYCDVKQPCFVGGEAPPYTDPPRRRPDLRIFTEIQRFPSGLMTAIDEESACSSLDLSSLTPTPQTPPLAHTPRSTMTVVSLSRSPWL